MSEDGRRERILNFPPSQELTVVETARASTTKRSAIILLIALLGILQSVATWSHGDASRSCNSDFLNFYTGGRLAFSGGIYSPDAEMRVQNETLGCEGKYYGQFIRLPYFAALMWPLSRLPFPAALEVWRFLCLAAIAGFLWWWPGPRSHTLAVCSWSFGLVAAFAYGQDVPILLLTAGAAIALVNRRRDFLAGLVLAAGVGKPHVFAFMMLILLLRRRLPAALGLGIGGSVAIALSFLAGGLYWPADVWKTLTGPWGSPNSGNMINLHGLTYALRTPLRVEILLSAAVLLAILYFCRNVSDQMALSMALAGGVLLGGHSYLYDLAFAIPLVLTVLASRQIPEWLKWAAVIAASPLLYLMPAPSGWPPLVHFLLPALVVLTTMAMAVMHSHERIRHAVAAGTHIKDWILDKSRRSTDTLSVGKGRLADVGRS